MHLKTILMRAEVMANIEIDDEFYSTNSPNVTIVVKSIDRKRSKITILNNIGRVTTISPARLHKFYTKKEKS